LGSLIATTCASRSGSASIHTGFAKFNGIVASFWRSAGASGSRAAMWRRMSATKSPR